MIEVTNFADKTNTPRPDDRKNYTILSLLCNRHCTAIVSIHIHNRLYMFFVELRICKLKNCVGEVYIL